MEPSPVVRDATSADAEALARIYSRYVLETTACFEEERVSAEDMAQRLAEVAASKLPWLVVEEGGSVLGYAYASKWKGRCAYRFAAETSVYLDPNATRRGLGGRLYAELLVRLKASGLHVVIGGIALPNEASIALHERMGFEKVAHFREVGFKFGRWIDVGYWELIIPTVTASASSIPSKRVR